MGQRIVGSGQVCMVLISGAQELHICPDALFQPHRRAINSAVALYATIANRD